MVSRVKGTIDYLDTTLLNFVIDQAKHHLNAYNFTEIITPILEHTDLFKRSLGLQTDVVTKQMFIIENDPDICLRPEQTAATVRVFVHHPELITPWKVFSYGPMFRYERPQKGRYRQFSQINAEIVSTASIMQDVRLITMFDRFFNERLGLQDYVLQLNFLGCFDDRKAYRIILKEYLDTLIGLCRTCEERKEKNILRVFDCKNEVCQKQYEKAPVLVDYLCEPCNTEWEELCKQLELLSVNFVRTPHLVRGLDYYNKTVFEFMSEQLGAQSAFCGGGRYDQLVGQIGHKKDEPSIGGAIGMERLLLLLESHRDRLPIPHKPALSVIIPVTKAQQPIALFLADQLTAHGFTVDALLEGDSLKSMMRKANKLGATYALVIGDEEQQNNEVTVKQMVGGKQERVKQSAVIEYLKR